MVIHVGRTGDCRWWLAAGAVLGLGLANKHSVGLFGVALFAGALLSGGWRMMLNRWFVARRHGVVRQTVHEWLARYAADGLAGLADRSPRPASCPHQMAAVTEARIAGMRREHPGWGPSRVRWELERAGVVPLPGRSAVYRALVRHGLVQVRRRRRRREDYRRWERPRAMDLWQMDVMGRVCRPGTRT